MQLSVTFPLLPKKINELKLVDDYMSLAVYAFFKSDKKVNINDEDEDNIWSDD